MAKIIQYPNNQEQFDSLRAYLSISMYLLHSGTGIDDLSKMFTDRSDVLAKNETKTTTDKTTFFSKLVNAGTSVVDTATDILEQGTIATSLIKPDANPVLIFNTYIPLDMALNMQSDWNEASLFSKVGLGESIVKSLDFGLAGKLISNNIESIKNHLQYYSATGLTPPKVKIFEPSFLEQDLEFEFIPESKQEADEILLMIKVFKESQIPFSNDGEIFKFPAVFKMEVNLNGDVVTNDGNTIEDMFLKFDNLGLTNITAVSMGEGHVDAKVKQDGKFPAYKVSMKFTMINKLYSTEDLETRLNRYLDKITRVG